MPPDPQNPIPEESSIPVSPQEPTEQAPIPPSTPEQVEVPPVAPESPREAVDAVPVNNNNEQIEPVELETPTPEQTAQIEEVEENKPVSEATTQPTAQIPVNEPLAQEPVPTPEPQPIPETILTTQAQTSTPLVISTSLARELLIKAREVIQFRKRKKLEKIMGMFLKQASITNDNVQKLLYVSDATATRYLDQLEKEGRIKKENAGKYLSYSRM